MELNDYEKIENLGSGSYGTVYKARERATNNFVAMKKINADIAAKNGMPGWYIREVSLLKSLQHENIVQLHDILWKGNTEIYLIFEYMHIDLAKYIEKYEPNGIRLRVVRSYLYQIAKGVEFCHKRAVIHRDLKTDNILISENGLVKIADFGLSRSISVPFRAYTTFVVTLWYRAPELLLLGNSGYAFPVDMWSVGCIFAEMVMGGGLFPGDSEIDQIRKIFSILGAPNDEQWPGITQSPNYPTSFNESPTEKGLERKVLIRGFGLELLEMLLVYNPSKRMSAKQMLTHQYFSGIDPYLLYPPYQ